MNNAYKDKIKANLANEYDIGGLIWEYCLLKGIIKTEPDGTSIKHYNDYIMKFRILNITGNGIEFINDFHDVFRMPLEYATSHTYRKSLLAAYRNGD